MAQGARRIQTVRQRHASASVSRASAPERMEAQLRKWAAGSASSAQGGAPASPAARLAAALASAVARRLHRAGHSWSARRYFEVSSGLGIGAAAIVLTKTGSPIAAVVAGALAGILVPHMVLGDLIARRRRAFITKLPEAIELLVCGLRSGLPVSETLGLVTNEVPGPVGQEFKLVTERMRIGRSMEDALNESAERLSMPEFNFFCITLAIHRETGGNLTETLVNLADVLRRRAAMTLKIRALSSESRASAIILGALPFVVFAIIWAADATYLSGFFTDRRLIITGLGGLVWMAIGAGVMARMVSFNI